MEVTCIRSKGIFGLVDFKKGYFSGCDVNWNNLLEAEMQIYDTFVTHTYAKRYVQTYD